MRIRNSNPRHKGDRGRMSLVAILALGITVLAVLTSGPRAWATVGQDRLHQTVPTETPTPTETPEATETPTPGPTPEATETPTPRPTSEETETPSPTPTRKATPTPTRAPEEPTTTPEPTTKPTSPPEKTPPAAPVELALNQTCSSAIALPGTVLTFTLQLTNLGPAELLDVRIEDVLPSQLLLQEVAVYSGQVETTDNRVTITLARLSGGQTVVITVRVLVAADAVPGTIIDHQPVVFYAGMEQYWPLLSVALPPAELPPTGGVCPAP